MRVYKYTITVSATLRAEANAQYQANSTGPLSELLSSSYVSERPSNAVLDGLNANFHKSLPSDRPSLLYQYITAPMVANPQDANGISAFVSLVQPEAHGYVQLASADYHDAPLIFSNCWGSQADLGLVLYGYKKLRGAMASEILAPIVEGELFPGVEAQTDLGSHQSNGAECMVVPPPGGNMLLGEGRGRQLPCT